MQSGMGTQRTTVTVMFLCLVGENRGSLCYSLYVLSIPQDIEKALKQDKEKEVNLTSFHHPPHHHH